MTAASRGPISLFASVIAGLACLTSIGCGGSPEPNSADTEKEDDEVVVAAYLAEYPDLLTSHAHWHGDSFRGSPTYGLEFLAFHRDMIERHDAWRAAQGYGPLAAWDPSDPLPASAHHAGRLTDDPSAVDPLCKTPEWFKMDGAGARNPDFGAGRLPEFTSADQLGRAVDSLAAPNWHSRVHATTGGDLASVHSLSRDPAFWRFHKFIDEIWRQWEQATDATTP